MDQYEAAADIEFTVDTSDNSVVGQDSVTVPIASIDTSKEVEIEQIRGNNLKPIGFSITEIDYSGSVTFDGNGYVEVDGVTVHLEDLFTDDDGIPVDGSNIDIYHEGISKQTTYNDVMVTSDAYDTDSGEVSGVTFDWIASDRNREDVS